jgi:hypothetical protein
VCLSANRSQTANSAACPCEIGMDTFAPGATRGSQAEVAIVDRTRVSISGANAVGGLLRRGGALSQERPDIIVSKT